MFERVNPNIVFSYENFLMEYDGIVYVDGSDVKMSGSPAILVTHNPAQVGTYTVKIMDFVPIYNRILTSDGPLDVGAMYTQGYSSTCVCIARGIQTTTPPFAGRTTCAVQNAQLDADGRVYFLVRTSVNGAFAKTGFTFKISVTAQMERLVQGLGA